MIGFIGLALDGGHLYLTKTELQNGADACALAASYELTGAPAIPRRPSSAPKLRARRWPPRTRSASRAQPIAAGDVTVAFGSSLSAGSAWVGAAGAPANAKYVRCTLQQTGIAPWFMQVLGFGNQTVNALATATLAPAQTNCAVPMALCA